MREKIEFLVTYLNPAENKALNQEIIALRLRAFNSFLEWGIQEEGVFFPFFKKSRIFRAHLSETPGSPRSFLTFKSSLLTEFR